MTETVTAPVETSETENTAPAWAPKDQLSALAFEEVRNLVTEYNTGRKRLDANSGDVTPLLEDLRRTSDDPKVVDLRQKYDALIDQAEKIVTQMNNLLKAEVEKLQMSDEEKAALDTNLKSLRTQIKGIVEMGEKRDAGFATAVPALVGSKSSGGAKKGSGEGIRRPRISTIYIDNEPATKTVQSKDGDKTVSTFTIAAQKMGGVKVEDLHAAYFAAAGTTEIEYAPESVEFVLTVGDKSHTVRVDK